MLPHILNNLDRLDGCIFCIFIINGVFQQNILKADGQVKAILVSYRPTADIQFKIQDLTPFSFFKLDEATLLAGVKVTEISEWTMLKNFRNRRIHSCYRIG